MPLFHVTGVPGWLGTRLARTLMDGLPDDPRFPANRDHRVVGLALPSADVSGLKKECPALEFRAGDVRDPASLRDFLRDAKDGLLFHCAGIIHPGRVRDFYDINLDGTRNLLRAAEEAGVRRIVIMSSNSPIGVSLDSRAIFDEQSPYRPYMNYGRSKMLMEQAVAVTQSRGKLETVIIRSPWFYGPDQPLRQTLFFTMIREGKAPIVGDGRNLRSMAYVDNICQGMQLAAWVPEANGRTYWIADRSPYTMNDVMDTIERLLENEFGLKCAHKRMRLPGLAGQVAQAVDSAMQAAGLYNQKIHVLGEMNKTIACSVEKAVKELGFDPKIGLEEGMRRSIRWCLDHGMTI